MGLTFKPAAAAAIVVALLAGCLPEPAPFRCETDAQCGDGLRCIVDVAACAEASDQCASGWQYVAASELGGTCVPPTTEPPPFTRDVCLAGPAMPTGRDACVDLVCAADATCCTLGWTDHCVARAGRTCAAPSGAADSRCPADATLIGRGLVSTLRFRPAPTMPSAVHCQPELGGGGDLAFGTNSAWADVDGDGDVDLAAAAMGGLRIYDGRGVTPAHVLDLGEPIVTVSDPTPHLDTSYVWGSRVAWGDAEHDGDLDLLWFDEELGLRLFRHDAGAPPTYAPIWLITAAELGTVRRRYAAGWMQLDADPDLEIVATLDTRLVIFDRQPTGQWASSNGPSIPDAGFAATFDRLVTTEGQVYSAGNLSLVAGQAVPFGTDRGITVGDVDGDGLLDIVIGQYNAVRLASGSGGGFEPPRTLTTVANPDIWGLAIGDLDGDRLLDIVGSSHTSVPTVLLQRQQETFIAPVVSPLVDSVDAQTVTLTGVATISAGPCVTPQ